MGTIGFLQSAASFEDSPLLWSRLSRAAHLLPDGVGIAEGCVHAKLLGGHSFGRKSIDREPDCGFGSGNIVVVVIPDEYVEFMAFFADWFHRGYCVDIR